MGVVALLLIIALILGGIGLAVHALWWMLIIAGALFLLSALTGMRRRSV
ncbi:MAG: hydrophobic protein [Acidimicrobiales bacterium]